MMHVTQEAERRSFYRQVFNLGTEPVPGDGIANTDFRRLLEDPDARVGPLPRACAGEPEPGQLRVAPERDAGRRGPAVQPLDHCTGMATVITPLIYAELDFVIERILRHPEVLRADRAGRRLVVEGGREARRTPRVGGRGPVLYNKARFGYSLHPADRRLHAVAVRARRRFSAFISDVDAFITTQSILQDETRTRCDGAGGGRGRSGSPERRRSRGCPPSRA